MLGDGYLQLACRHHILELICGASSSLVYHAGKEYGKKKENSNKKGTESPGHYPFYKGTTSICWSCSNIFVAMAGKGHAMRHGYKELIELGNNPVPRWSISCKLQIHI